MSARRLPDHPSVRQLRQQAKDLLRTVRTGDPGALADFRQSQPRVAVRDARLADAQLVLARSYGASSWPRLIAASDLIDALRQGELDSVRDLALSHPELARDYDSSSEPGSKAAMAAAATGGLGRIVRCCSRPARGTSMPSGRDPICAHGWT